MEKENNVNFVQVLDDPYMPKTPLKYELCNGAEITSASTISTTLGEEYECLDDHIEQALEEQKRSSIKSKFKSIEKDEKVNHPNYYNRYSVEVIEMARRIWGDEAMKTAAEITAFIYRMRAGVKPDNPVKQDLDKEEFWLNYAKKLQKVDRSILKERNPNL